MAAKRRTAEARLEGIASRAHGIVTREDALAAGLSRHQIQHRRRIGLLLPTGYRGVYRLGHRAPSLAASYMAAVKACGFGESQIRAAAAAHWLGLTKGKPPPPELSVRTAKRIRGLRLHRVRRGPPPERMLWRGIPTTTPAQTIIDLAGRLSEDSLAAICHEAGVKHGTTPAQVRILLDRRPAMPGIAKLRRVLGFETRVTLSYLERRFLALLRAEGLPLPGTNRPAGGRRVDCRWPEHRLTVELDSYGFHNSRHSWERDHRREREAFARGDEFRRYTYGDVLETPAVMLAELRELLVEPSADPRVGRGG